MLPAVVRGAIVVLHGIVTIRTTATTPLGNGLKFG
jgi:hypothetical protein